MTNYKECQISFHFKAYVKVRQVGGSEAAQACFGRHERRNSMLHRTDLCL